ncbi:MAG: hypothetical protein ACREQ5_39035, partial [Candidatus Dormibacteria bacterium]
MSLANTVVASLGSLSSSGTGFPFLTTIVLLPAVAAVVVALIPRSKPKLVQGAAMTAALAAFGLAVAIAVRFTVGEAG